jgi:hypothetical protein
MRVGLLSGNRYREGVIEVGMVQNVFCQKELDVFHV